MIARTFIVMSNMLRIISSQEPTGTYYLFPTTPYIIELNQPNEEVKITRSPEGKVDITHKDPYTHQWTGPVEINDQNYNEGANYASNPGVDDIETKGKWVFSENFRPAYSPTPAEIMNSDGNPRTYGALDQRMFASNEFNDNNWSNVNPANMAPAAFGTSNDSQVFVPQNNYNNGNIGKPAGVAAVGAGTGVIAANQVSSKDNPEGTGTIKDKNANGASNPDKTKDGEKDAKGGNKKGKKDVKSKSNSKNNKKSDAASKSKKNSADAIKPLSCMATLLSIGLGYCFFNS